ncbi:MAG: hypothetical protein ACTHKG_06480 [Nocardioides sp.]
MQSVAFAVPVLPGQAAANLDGLASCRSGVRKEAFEDALRRAGITRQAVWIQTTPDGELSVVYLEADDLGAAFVLLGTSPAPFERWYREHVRQVHGIALADGCAPELVLDFDISAI